MSLTDAKIVLMGLVCLVLGGSSIAVAAGVGNAHKVDGIHAVRATATNEQAAKKLIATDASGRLNPRFVPKVDDADKLDGLDSGAFLGVTGKAADADTLDGKDSTAFLEPCDTGTLWGRAVISGSSVATGDNPSALSSAGVSNAYLCSGQAILARKNSPGVYKVVFGGTIAGNTIGQGGPPPMVSPLATGVVASTSGPFQCAPGSPPVLYEICYNVRTTNLAGTPVDANFTITVQ